jgi:hypothetical protein
VARIVRPVLGASDPDGDVVVLANVALILYKHRADEIEQGRRPERLWGPLMGANLGLCLLHVGIGIFIALGLY